jgi:LacI family transcriptional regulator
MSITKVAKIAGVSTCTVSRVINGAQNVSAQTSNRVHRAMDKIGYTPPPPELRRGPTGKNRNIQSSAITSRYISVLVLAKGTFYETGAFLRLMRGINNAASEQELFTTFNFIDNDQVPLFLKDKEMFKNIFGVITVWGEPAGELTKILEGIPVVNISSRETSSGDITMVGSELIGRMAANYLFEKGCNHTAYINPIYHHPGYKARCEGFNYFMCTNSIKTESFNDKSISPHQLYNLDLNLVKEKTELLLKEMIKLDPLPEGLFLPNDRITMIAYNWFESNGIKPNEDILIISSDDDENLCKYRNHPATVSVKSEDVGRNAVEQLTAISKSPETSSQVQVIMKPVLIDSKATEQRSV